MQVLRGCLRLTARYGLEPGELVALDALPTLTSRRERWLAPKPN